MKPAKEIPMLDLRAEYEYMKEEIDSAIKNCLESQRWIFGPEVKNLEERIAGYIDVEHCIGTSSGTEALVLSLRALAINLKGKEYFDRDDRIITSPFTFTATADAILRAGATPVFVDIDAETCNIDTYKIREYLTRAPEPETRSSTKVIGILPVHIYGQSCDMDEIMSIADEFNLFVVEDGAQAFGGTWKGKKLGSLGKINCFSFFPSKNLGGFGDGGMVATDDGEVSELVRMLLTHGGRNKYNVEHIGYNARLDTLQAAVLLAKLKYIDDFNTRRRRIAERYNNGLMGIDDITLPVMADGHVFHQYTVRIKEGKRDSVQEFLKENNVSSMVYYPFPLHKMKVFEERSITHGSLMNAETAPREVLSLPIEPLMDDESIDRVISVFKDAFAALNK